MGQTNQLTTDRIIGLLVGAGYSDAALLDNPIGIGMDSMDRVEFGMLVEQEFNIQIPDADLYKLERKSFAEWATFVDELKSKKA